MKKILTLKDIAEKSKIKISNSDAIDFSKRSTHVLVYFNDLTKPHYNLFAELLISHNKQPQLNVFELVIPITASEATIIVSTKVTGHSLDSIEAQAI